MSLKYKPNHRTTYDIRPAVISAVDNEMRLIQVCLDTQSETIRERAAPFLGDDSVLLDYAIHYVSRIAKNIAAKSLRDPARFIKAPRYGDDTALDIVPCPIKKSCVHVLLQSIDQNEHLLSTHKRIEV